MAIDQHQGSNVIQSGHSNKCRVLIMKVKIETNVSPSFFTQPADRKRFAENMFSPENRMQILSTFRRYNDNSSGLKMVA